MSSLPLAIRADAAEWAVRTAALRQLIAKEELGLRGCKNAHDSRKAMKASDSGGGSAAARPQGDPPVSIGWALFNILSTPGLATAGGNPFTASQLEDARKQAADPGS
jgi:hypothetical protein